MCLHFVCVCACAYILCEGVFVHVPTFCVNVFVHVPTFCVKVCLCMCLHFV